MADGTGEVDVCAVAGPANDVPHSLQNLCPAACAAPQDGQRNASADPHSPQNFDPSLFST
jgi:hypothetical protein